MPRKTPSRRHQVQIRLSDAELADLLAACRAAEMGRSDFIRYAIGFSADRAVRADPGMFPAAAAETGAVLPDGWAALGAEPPAECGCYCSQCYQRNCYLCAAACCADKPAIAD